MKTFFLFLLLCTLGGCKDNPKPKTELEKLPPATQEGKNTFGCLVNGKAWVTRTSIDAVAFYQEGLLHIGADLQGHGESMRLAVNDKGTLIISGRQFDLSGKNEGAAEFFSNLRGCNYFAENTISGSLKITNHDPDALIISGLFEFSSIVTGCDTIKVANGRFDLTYAN